MTSAPRPDVSSGAPFALVGKVLRPDGLRPGSVVVAGDRIDAVLDHARPADLPAQRFEADVVASGLIDLQINGGFGHDLAGRAGALRGLAESLPATGVTGFLPTYVSGRAPDYERWLAFVAAEADGPGARVLGIHAEGPYLSPRRSGAHDRAAIEAAGSDERPLEILLASGRLALVTLAPELPGAPGRIARLRQAGVVVSLGHTDATYDEVRAGADAGATMVTHLYNAMSPFQARAPGAVAAAWLDNRLVTGLIPDGVHTHAAALALARRLKGPDGIVLVTDALAAAGLPPGRSTLGNQPVVSDGGAARLEDGTLAGSVLTLDEAVRRYIRLAGASVEDALAAVTSVPARLLGLADRGRVMRGAVADLVMLDSDLRPIATFVGGRMAYTRSEPG